MKGSASHSMRSSQVLISDYSDIRYYGGNSKVPIETSRRKFVATDGIQSICRTILAVV